MLYINRCQSYVFYQRIQFDSAGATIYANLYYPQKDLDFQEKHPLVIYAHGIGWQKDIDLRISLELTKRGFFVASLDYQGHGESSGHLLTVDQITGKPGLAQDCSKLLDAIESLDAYNQIDGNQVGLIGHSMGGLVVLINGAVDPRFSATISWAGVADISGIGNYLGDEEGAVFAQYSPTNIMDSSHPKNLLLIHHLEDTVVDYEDNALIAQGLTGCTLITITRQLVGGGHALFADEVMIETINWYESVFFGSETVNGPIILTFLSTFIFIGMSLMGLCFTALSLMIFVSKYILKPELFDYSTKSSSIDEEISRSTQNKKKVLLILTIVFFIGIWYISSRRMALASIIVTPLLILIIYPIYKWILKKVFDTSEKEKIELKENLKSETTVRPLLYALCCSGIFLGLYFPFAIAFPFALFYPHTVFAFALTVLILPLYLSSEIFYRKMMFPLLDFIESRKKRTYAITFLTLFVQIFYIVIASGFMALPALAATFLAMIMASIMNGIIYHKTGKFSAVLLNSFIVVGIFFGAVASLALNLIGSLSLIL